MHDGGWWCFHSVHWGINPPLKNINPSISQALPPTKSANCSSPPFFRQSPYILVFREPSPPPSPKKITFFSEVQNIETFYS